MLPPEGGRTGGPTGRRATACERGAATTKTLPSPTGFSCVARWAGRSGRLSAGDFAWAAGDFVCAVFAAGVVWLFVVCPAFVVWAALVVWVALTVWPAAACPTVAGIAIKLIRTAAAMNSFRDVLRCLSYVSSIVLPFNIVPDYTHTVEERPFMAALRRTKKYQFLAAAGRRATQ